MIERLNQLESIVTDLVAKLAPWLAPLPTAYLVYRATVAHLAWPVWVGLVAAAVIESLGLASTSTALVLWDWNKAKRKSDPAAPVGLALALVGAYFVTATGLTVILDILPQAATVAPAIFPALSLTGVTILALRSDHRRRVVAVEAARLERKTARRSRNQTGNKPATRPETTPPAAGTYTGISGTTKDRARAILAERPGISGAELGRQVGRSPRLGRKLKAELLPVLEPAGIAQGSNGKGIEALAC